MSFDQSQARREGWRIAENSEGRLEIQKDDAVDCARFTSDYSADDYVRMRASIDDDCNHYHIAAVNYVDCSNARFGIGPLIIGNVDLELLEKQRKSLQHVISCLRVGYKLPGVSTVDVENLEGLENMLDAWSDERYFAKKHETDN